MSNSFFSIHSEVYREGLALVLVEIVTFSLGKTKHAVTLSYPGL